MIIGRDFVFVLPPKCASSSISVALADHGVRTYERHEPLKTRPPHPIVAVVVRDHADMIRSATRNGARGFIAYGGRDIRDISPDTWSRWVNMRLDFCNLSTDWRRFCNAVGIDVPLPHLNKTAANLEKVS